MPKKRRKTTRTRRKTPRKTRAASAAQLRLKSSTQRQIGGVVQICLAILLFLVFRGQAGPVGEYVNQGLVFFFGRWGIVLPIFLLFSGFFQAIAPNSSVELKRTTGLLLCLFSFLGLVHIGVPETELAARRDELGGAIGFLMSMPLLFSVGRIAGIAILVSAFASGILIAFEPDIGSLVRRILSQFKTKSIGKTRSRSASRAAIQEDEQTDDEDATDLIEQDRTPPELNIVRPVFAQQMVQGTAKELAKGQKKDDDSDPIKRTQKHIKDALQMKDTRFEEWTFPSFELLDSAHSELKVNDDELKLQARLIEEKLEEFGIDVTMRDAHPGPTVTQFTLQPSEGVKLSKIANLKDDLALALAAQSLRIEAPIPGKALVGIEMPNRERTTVHLREILESSTFTESESALSLPLGRDVGGDATMASLEEMPHLLIAGATGSGKSVCMNTFLTAMLFQNAPHELKFILIDPKRVELMPYDNIPHLLTPVITESEKALQALRWAVAEMGRRLHRFSEVGARNIDEYNEKQMEEENVLPRIVIVIDELADLMMRQFRKDTETMIARIAQMARAVGMHLIIATQRPSVDVITGIIKANIPARIAFRTVSAVDSRTILDCIGSEDLLGRGDMLFRTATSPRPHRIQGIYISTKEVERVINAVKIAGGGKITEQIGLGQEEENEDNSATAATSFIDLDADDNGGDDLFFDAVQVIQETGKASASLLQRRLSVGYARAAKLLDIMEEKGFIGPSRGAKAREIYIDKVANS